MGLKAFEGFSHYGSVASTGDFWRRLDNPIQYNIYGSANPLGFSLVTGFEGTGKMLEISGIGFLNGLPTQTFVSVFNQRAASQFMGVRVNPHVNGGFGLLFYDTLPLAPTIQCSVLFNMNNFAIYTYRGSYASGGTLLGVSANNVWTTNTLQFVEVWPVISPTVGAVTVKIGNQTISGCTVSGVNTQSSVNASWDTVGWEPEHNGLAGSQNSIDICDLYWGDTTVDSGTYPANTPVGDFHVYTLFPASNNSVTWSPIANTNWQEISEPVFDGDGSYNFTATINNEDNFIFQPLASTVTGILAAQLTGGWRKDDAGARMIEHGCLSVATEVYGATWSLPNNNYVYFTDLFRLDPNGNINWTRANLNLAAFGYKLVS